MRPLNHVTDAALAAFKRPGPNRSDQAISAVAPVRTAGYGRPAANKTQEKGEPTNRRAIQPSISQVWAIFLCVALLTGCASTKTSTFEDVKPADELYADGLELLEGRRILGLFTLVNYDSAIERFQAIVDNYPYSEFEERAQLKIADAYFADDRFEEALAYYQDFADLHPQHPRIAYTLLRAAQCHYNQIESFERDQGSTVEATAALEKLMHDYPYSEETRVGEEMMVKLRTRLALNMLHIADFYVERTHWQSAAARYRRVLDEYPGLGLDARALFRLGLCLENMRRADEALRLYHVVVENYSATASARRARSRIARAE